VHFYHCIIIQDAVVKEYSLEYRDSVITGRATAGIAFTQQAILRFSPRRGDSIYGWSSALITLSSTVLTFFLTTPNF